MLGAFDLCPDGVAVVAFVAADDVDAARKERDQRFGGDAVRNLSAGQQEAERAAEAVRRGVDFRRPPAARAADRALKLPPLPPDADRCALTAEESMRTWLGGPPASASASNSRRHTPFIRKP